MVLIWSDLACADHEATAVLVAINSVFQIVAYSFLGYFYITLLPKWLGLHSQVIHIGLWPVARTVLIFLGIRWPPATPVAALACARAGGRGTRSGFCPVSAHSLSTGCWSRSSSSSRSKATRSPAGRST